MDIWTANKVLGYFMTAFIGILLVAAICYGIYWIARRPKVLATTAKLAAKVAILYHRLTAARSQKKKAWKLSRLQVLVLGICAILGASLAWGLTYSSGFDMSWGEIIAITASIAVAAISVIIFKSNATRQQIMKVGKKLQNETAMTIAGIILGILAFHWLLWATFPSTWNAWYATPSFLAIQFAVLVAVFLLTLKGPARYLGMALIALVIMGLASGNVAKLWENADAPVSVASFGASNPVRVADENVTLSLIAECESGGKQFEEDGVTLLYNSKEGSSAVGKYQIVESLHSEKAKAAVRGTIKRNLAIELANLSDEDKRDILIELNGHRELGNSPPNGGAGKPALRRCGPKRSGNKVFRGRGATVILKTDAPPHSSPSSAGSVASRRPSVGAGGVSFAESREH